MELFLFLIPLPTSPAFFFRNYRFIAPVGTRTGRNGIGQTLAHDKALCKAINNPGASR
jgi:hypothetical protein